MTIIYEDEAPATPKGKIVYEERRSAPESSFLKDKAPFFLGPFGPLRALQEGGALLDKAAYNAGGLATDVAAKAGLAPETAAKLGFVANVATQAIPTFGAGPLGAKLAPMIEKGARGMMQSALKPTLANLESGKAAKAITTMLDEGFNATEGGVNAMRSQVNQLNQEIAAAIANSPATIDKGAVASRLYDSLRKFSNQVTPTSDVNAIKKAWTEFMNHPMLAGNAIPVQQAQAMKQGTYKTLGERAFGELKGAEIEAQKQLARGLKEEIATAVPGISSLNKKESELLNALQVAERRALMDGNKNPAGWALLASHPASFAAFMADKSALFKSIVARMLHAGKEAVPENAARAVGGALGASTATAPD